MEDLASKIIELGLEKGASYVDVRIEKGNNGKITVSNGKLEKTSFGFESGVGITVLFNGAWGFSSTSSLEWSKLSKSMVSALKTAKIISKKIKEENKASLADTPTIKGKDEYLGREKLINISLEEKISLTLDLDKVMEKFDGRIKNATVNYLEGYGEKFFMNNEGTEIKVLGSRCYLSMQAVAVENGKVQSYRSNAANKGGFDGLKEHDLENKALETAEKAIVLLKAKPAPSGKYTALIDPELIGVFVHEALGHALEADSIVSGESILANKLNKKICAEEVNVVDDSTLNWWGSEKFDDEGTPTEKRVVIKNGVLKNYLLNRETASKLNLKPNGSARAMNYSYKPIVRMSNTYLVKGTYSLEEVLNEIKEGIYVKGSRGGQVDTATGTFQFNAQEAYKIEKGQITTPLLDVSLSGLTLETLNKVEAICKDFKLNVGFCGKNSQLVPVGDGGPHVKVSEVVIGGRKQKIKGFLR